VRRLFILVIAASTSLSGRAVPQTSALVRHRITDHISFALPADWIVGATFQPGVQAGVDSLLLHSKDSVLQASLRSGVPQTLLVAHSPSGTLSVNLNITPSPGATASTFAHLSPDYLSARTQTVCRLLGDTFAGLQGALDSCGPVASDTAGGRSIIVVPYRNHNASAAFVCWLAQYAAPDAILTITLMARKPNGLKDRPLLAKIWRSLRLT